MCECIIVKKVRDVAREEISRKVEDLYSYSNLLIEQGHDSYDMIGYFV